MLEAFLDEEFRRIQREIQILREKLALPCNDTEREATETAIKVNKADLAEIWAFMREIREERERAAVREERERAAVREMEERAAVRQEQERAAVREMEERAAVHEVLRENQQHETLLNLSKEINQILDAKRAVREKLIASSTEDERQCLESVHADLQTRENIAIANHEAYLKQGMATSL